MKKSLQLATILTIGLLAAAPAMARPKGWNGPMALTVDWVGARNDVNTPIRFVFIKATEGNTYQNSVFSGKMHYAQAAGIYAGAYHRCNPYSNSAYTEAHYFWDYAGAAYKADLATGYTMAPALDVENELGHTYYNSGNGNHDISLTEWCNRWYGYVKDLAAADGVTMHQVVYVNEGSAHYLNSAIGGWSWIASVNNGEDALNSGNPWDGTGHTSPWGGTTWRIWQYKWNATSIYTDSGALCNNAYNGSASDIGNDIGCKAK